MCSIQVLQTCHQKALWPCSSSHKLMSDSCRAGTTYSEFIRMMHLPSQLAHVDPIVASFCGGAVGVLSAFMVVEANNAKAQEKRRCQYCEVTLPCCLLTPSLQSCVAVRFIVKLCLDSLHVGFIVFGLPVYWFYRVWALYTLIELCLRAPHVN